MKIVQYTLLFILLTAVWACSRKSASVVISTYTVTGDSDIEVGQYEDTTVTVLYHVAFPAGFYEPVTLSIINIPPGVTVSPAQVSDTTSFSVLVTYHIHIDAAASFPVTVTLFSGSFGTTTSAFNIVVKPGVAFSYSIDPLQDITVSQYTDTIVKVPVTTIYNSGIKANVTISADVLPAGVTVVPASATGIPGFTDTFAFHIVANTKGTNPVTLDASTGQTVKSASFNVNVTQNDACAQELTGYYTGSTTCTSFTGTGTNSNQQVTATGPGQVLIQLPFANVIANLDCTHGTFDTEPASSPGYTVPAGTGSFDANTIVVNYSLSGSLNGSCKTILTR